MQTTIAAAASTNAILAVSTLSALALIQLFVDEWISLREAGMVINMLAELVLDLDVIFNHLADIPTEGVYDISTDLIEEQLTNLHGILQRIEQFKIEYGGIHRVYCQLCTTYDAVDRVFNVLEEKLTYFRRA